MIPYPQQLFLTGLFCLAGLFSRSSVSAQVRALQVAIAESIIMGPGYETVPQGEISRVALFVSPTDTCDLKFSGDRIWSLEDQEVLKKLEPDKSYRVEVYDDRQVVGTDSIHVKDHPDESDHLSLVIFTFRKITLHDRLTDFVALYQDRYTVVQETFSSEYNDFVLNTRATALSKEELTLKSKSAFVNDYNQKVYQRLYFGFYEYETPAQCEAALDSLLKCFGSDCASLKWGDSLLSVKTTPRVYIINEQEIIACKIKCEQESVSWIDLVSALMEVFGEKPRFILSGCGGYTLFGDLR